MISLLNDYNIINQNVKCKPSQETIALNPRENPARISLLGKLGSVVLHCSHAEENLHLRSRFNQV